MKQYLDERKDMSDSMKNVLLNHFQANPDKFDLKTVYVPTNKHHQSNNNTLDESIFSDDNNDEDDVIYESSHRRAAYLNAYNAVAQNEKDQRSKEETSILIDQLLHLPHHDENEDDE